MATLIKVDRNGSKHYQGYVECERCNGLGLYAIGMLNGKPWITTVDNGICHKCGGRGKVLSKWIERTPEYQAKLDAKREAKAQALQAKWEAEQAQREAERLEKERQQEEERKAKEEALRAQKSISQYVGEVGQRIEGTYILVNSASWEQPSFRGFGTDTMYCHIFKDEAGNIFTWKTSNGVFTTEIRPNGNPYYRVAEAGEKVTLKGTIKEHTEYKEEKQTVLTRCKVLAIV